jgi:DegV family protein with EDD domain
VNRRRVSRRSESATVPGMSVAVVTDSTAYLPADLVATSGITVVPLSVVINGVEGVEGREVTPAEVARALGTRRQFVTTSRPSPAEFVAAYRSRFEAGATGVVSVHISGALSGTYEAAELAAAELEAAGSAGRVAVVDSRSTGMGLGFPVLAAAAAAAEGGDLWAVRRAALDSIARTSTYFYVDTLEFLRRGGRIGAASALVGTALSVKPILHVVDGAIVVRDKVRTAGRALARLVDLALEAAGDVEVDIAVHHLDARDRAEALLDRLDPLLGDRLRERYVTELGAAVAAHVGPGMAAVVVHRRG